MNRNIEKIPYLQAGDRGFNKIERETTKFYKIGFAWFTKT